MARIVELFGPPGVGKTTICNAIDNMWTISDKWIPASRIFLLKEDNTFFKGFKRLFFKNVFPAGDAAAFKLKEAEKKFIATFPAFINAYWESIALESGFEMTKDLRFDKVKYLQQRIQKIQLISDYETDKLCLVDEGIVHMLPGTTKYEHCDDEIEDQIANLLELCPLPVAIVDIDTDSKEIANRLYKREKVIPMHRDLNMVELENLTNTSRKRRRIIIKLLEKMGVPVLKIDSGLDAELNAMHVVDFLTNTLSSSVININQNPRSTSFRSSRMIK